MSAVMQNQILTYSTTDTKRSSRQLQISRDHKALNDKMQLTSCWGDCSERIGKVNDHELSWGRKDFVSINNRNNQFLNSMLWYLIKNFILQLWIDNRFIVIFAVLCFVFCRGFPLHTAKDKEWVMTEQSTENWTPVQMSYKMIQILNLVDQHEILA